MKKVVFLIRNVAPEKYGGGETYQLELAKILKKNGFTPIIITASKKLIIESKKRKIMIISAPYLKMQNFSGLRNLLLPIYYIWQLRLYFWYRKQILKYNPEVMNIQSRDEWIAATTAGKKFGVKVLWTDHIDFRTWVFTNVCKKYKNQIGKWILRCAKKADKIIMISDYERENLRKTIGREKLPNVITIKNGLNDEYVRHKPKEKSFCFLGRVVDYKGINELLKAFLIVLKSEPEATLNIYGEGEELKKIQIEAKDVKQIHCFGYTDEPLKKMLENEIFVLPSYYEGLSLSLIAATMMKKRIIATNVDGNPEVVKNMVTGILVPAKNVKKLAEAMLWMLENPKKADKMAELARYKYEREFDFEKIFAEKMLSLYNREKE
ncbi:glycosyltransferase family 4 protein [Candidatus Saccharibacteria bacterium]|nr:glycosyltransferase family 4 protein [Candidatus Saccharibacteria bacterium]